MKNNHIYIDESGILNKVLVICFIVFSNKDSAKETYLKINKFTDQELHFNRESFSSKRDFFKILTKDSFSIRYYVVNPQVSTLSDYEHLIRSIIENKDVMNNSVLFIDGYKSKVYKKNISSKLKKELKSYSINIKSIKYIDSKKSALIQLADMCAGCIRRKLERQTKEDNELFDLIEKFIK